MTGVTPNGIRYPDGASQAKNLGPELQQMAEDIDTFIDEQIDAESAVFRQEAAIAAETAVDEKLDDVSLVRELELASRLNTFPGVVAYGDSLTFGTGSGSSETASYPAVLESHIGVDVVNAGIPSEASQDIAGRQGGAPLLATPAGGVLNASGNTVLTITRPDGSPAPNFMRLASSEVNPVEYAGVAGNITYFSGSGTWQFSPLNALDDPVTVIEPMPIITRSARAYGDLTHIFWAGTNNITEEEQILGDIATMVEHITALDRRYLVLGPLNREAETAGTPNHGHVVAIEAALQRSHGRRFVGVRRWLIDYGLTAAGLTPTTQDLADIANDVIPSQLRTDNVHLNATGYGLVAELVATRLREFRWLPPVETVRLRAEFTAADGTTLTEYVPEVAARYQSNGSGHVIQSNRLLTPTATTVTWAAQATDVEASTTIIWPTSGATPALGLFINGTQGTATTCIIINVTPTARTLQISRPAGDGGAIVLATGAHTPEAGVARSVSIRRWRDRVTVTWAGATLFDVRLTPQQMAIIAGLNNAGIRVAASGMTQPAWERLQIDRLA